MAAMGHDGPSLPFDFKFPFQNKSILIKSNLNNKTRQQMKNNIQVNVSDINWNVNIDLIFMSTMKFKCGLNFSSMIQMEFSNNGPPYTCFCCHTNLVTYSP